MRAVYTVAVAGHRPRNLPRDAARYIRDAIHEVADQNPRVTWLAGGAIGADQIATDVLLERGERVELVLPFDPEIQSARWSWVQRFVQFRQLLRAARVHVVRDRYDPAAYRDRNRVMVERANLLLAFWNGRPGSGTAMTVRMAEARRVPVIVVGMY